MQDLTADVTRVVQQSGIQAGMVNLCVWGLGDMKLGYIRPEKNHSCSCRNSHNPVFVIPESSGRTSKKCRPPLWRLRCSNN